MTIRIRLEFTIDDEGTVAIVNQQIVNPRSTLTPERLEQVRTLNDMGGVDMVAGALGISKSQAYRLIQQATKEPT